MIATQNGSGSFSAIALREALARMDQVDENKLVDLLIGIRSDAEAAKVQREIMAERQKSIESKVDKISDAIYESDRRNSEFERRIKALESRGVLAWFEGSTATRISKLAGVIIALSGAAVIFSKLWALILAHYK